MVSEGREEAKNLFYLIDRIYIAHPNRKLKFVYEVQRFHYGNFSFHGNHPPHLIEWKVLFQKPPVPTIYT